MAATHLDDEEFEIALIDEVRIRPFFYNKSDKNYMNTAMKEDEWDYVAASIKSAMDFPELTGKLCCGKWKDLRKRFDRAIRQYDDVRSGEEFPVDLDWLVVTEMQFLKDHIQNRPVLSTLRIPGVKDFPDCPETPNSTTLALDYVSKLQEEQSKFAGPLFPKKRNRTWLDPSEEKKKLLPFQALLPETVPELDDFAKVKLSRQNDIVTLADGLEEKLDSLSRLIQDQGNNEKQSYCEILNDLMSQMSPANKARFYDEAKSRIELLRSDYMFSLRNNNC